MVEGEKERLAGQDPAPNGGTAAEIERLRDALAGARGQLAATSEILAVIGRSASDLEGVLETVVESARNLCRADAGQVSLADAQRAGGYRTVMGVPMLLDGDVVGVLSVWRTQVEPFSDYAVEVLTTFAAQAALAVRTVDLVMALE